VVTVVLRVRVLAPDRPRRPPPGAQVRISVEDVSREDVSAPSAGVASFPVGGDDPVLGPFEVEADLVPGRDYGVRVHLDLAGDGEVRIGDLVSVARHSVRLPVSAAEGPAVPPVDMDVPARLVGP